MSNSWQRSNSNDQQPSKPPWINTNNQQSLNTGPNLNLRQHPSQSSQSWRSGNSNNIYQNNQSTIPQTMTNQQSQQNINDVLQVLAQYQTENKSIKIQLKTFSTTNFTLNTKVSQLNNQNNQMKQNNIKLKRENQSLKTRLSQLEKRLEQFECTGNQIYIRNEILTYNSKQLQDIKPQHNIDTEQKCLQALFDENEVNMKKWMLFTQTMNETYTKYTNNLSNNNNNMSLWKALIECKKLWQHQQNQMELIVQKLVQLQKKKAKLKNYVSGHNNAIKKQDEHYQQEFNAYNETHATRIKLESKLKSKLKKLNDCCDEENKLNNSKCILLDDLNRFNIELKQYESLLNYCNKLMKKYREFDSINEVAITKMENYFKNQWEENMKLWFEWSPESIVHWLKYLRENGTLILSGNVDLDEIFKQMETNGVNGKVFETIDKNDLQSIGFKIVSDRQNVFVEIQGLIMKYPRIRSYDEEGKNDNDTENVAVIPEEFLCPISKQIMNEPVLIFDGFTYEKANIEKHLNDHKRSPKTKEMCDEDDKWFTPNRPLKQKIMAFLKVNPQFRQTNYIL